MAGGDDDESSPSKKVKFLCSHGGRILVRPSDGHLKYLGGETRVVAVPRHVTFSELKQRLSEMVEGETVLKYQIMPEELDILVTVRTDEDLQHMIHEHDSSPRLRTFLFPIPAALSSSSSPNSASPEATLLPSPTNFHRVQSSPTLYRPNSPLPHLRHCRLLPSPARQFTPSGGRAPFPHCYQTPSLGGYNSSNNDDQLSRIIDRADSLPLPPCSPRRRLWD